MIGALPMTEEQLYTVNEVAKILRVHPVTVRRMIKIGELTAFMVRDEYRIRQRALEELMQRKDVEQQKDK